VGKKKNAIEPGVAQWDSITADAHALVYGDRGALYDHPAVDYQRTVDLFNSIVEGADLTAAEGVVFMLCVKLSRLGNGIEQGFPPEMLRDTIVDLAGYAECLYGVLTFVPPALEDELDDEPDDDDD
jgi:hypothetical protein